MANTNPYPTGKLDTSQVLWDASGRPYFNYPGSAAGKYFISPVEAAGTSMDPKLTAWAQQMGASITQDANAPGGATVQETGAQQGGGLLHDSARWDPAQGKYVTPWSGSKIGSLIVGSTIAAPFVASGLGIGAGGSTVAGGSSAAVEPSVAGEVAGVAAHGGGEGLIVGTGTEGLPPAIAGKSAASRIFSGFASPAGQTIAKVGGGLADTIIQTKANSAALNKKLAADQAALKWKQDQYAAFQKQMQPLYDIGSKAATEGSSFQPSAQQTPQSLRVMAGNVLTPTASQSSIMPQAQAPVNLSAPRSDTSLAMMMPGAQAGIGNPSATEQTVMMQGPDGTHKAVPASQVDHWASLGARRVA